MDKVELVRGIPLFAELDQRAVQAVAALARERTARAGEVLMQEGDPGETFLVIVDGTVRVEHAGRTIRSMTAGGFLGEVALVERGPRTATAVCVTDCGLLEIGAHEFERLMATFPDIRTKLLGAIGRRTRATGS